jgi:hypothetical protein
MSIFDEVLKQQHRAEARANALADEIIAALESARVDLTAQLTALRVRLLTAATWEEESLSRRKAFLEAQRAEVDRLISEIFKSKASAAISAAQDTMSHIQAQTLSTIEASRIVFGLHSPRLDLEAVQAWAEVTTIEGLTMNEWLSRMAASSADKIVQAGRQAMIQGMTVQQTARLIRQKGIEGSRPQIEAISRTFLLSASNHAREQTLEALAADLNFSWLYVATLDGRTCAVCGMDDGKVFKRNQERPSLPRHINCRCVYVPDFGKLFPDDVKRAAVKESGRTVHHRDGSTSTAYTVESVEHVTETYSEWISRQVTEDPAFARQVLGKTRFELLKAGKISLDRMVVDGRIKRLVELI